MSLPTGTGTRPVRGSVREALGSLGPRKGVCCVRVCDGQRVCVSGRHSGRAGPQWRVTGSVCKRAGPAECAAQWVSVPDCGRSGGEPAGRGVGAAPRRQVGRGVGPEPGSKGPAPGEARGGRGVWRSRRRRGARGAVGGASRPGLSAGLLDVQCPEPLTATGHAPSAALSCAPPSSPHPPARRPDGVGGSGA